MALCQKHLCGNTWHSVDNTNWRGGGLKNSFYHDLLSKITEIADISDIWRDIPWPPQPVSQPELPKTQTDTQGREREELLLLCTSSQLFDGHFQAKGNSNYAVVMYRQLIVKLLLLVLCSVLIVVGHWNYVKDAAELVWGAQIDLLASYHDYQSTHCCHPQVSRTASMTWSLGQWCWVLYSMHFFIGKAILDKQEINISYIDPFFR